MAARLVQIAREVGSSAWRAMQRQPLQAANTAAGLAPTALQFEAQLDMVQTERFVVVLDAMRGIGGAEISSYCFEMAENDAVPRERRLAALRVLDVTASTLGPAAAARRTAIAGRLVPDSPAPATSTSSVRNASEVVAMLGPKFKNCYDQLLQIYPDARGEARRLTLHVDATGTVAGVKSAGIAPGDFANCLEGVARAARFEPPSHGGATIVVPLTFAPP